MKQKRAEKCALCSGSGENRTGVKLRANNDLCPRCGGCGGVPRGGENPPTVTDQDREYMSRNGIVG